MLVVTTTLFTLNRRSLLWNRNSLFLSAFDLKMLCILFSYSYPVIRAVKGLQGKKILLQIKDIAEVILSLARLKLSSWYRTKNAIRIKNPYPWHLARVQIPHPPPPPHPLSMNQRRNFYWAEGGLYTGCWHPPSATPSPPGKDADE